jgi:soluble lytic murein transglycosylase-like protein
MQVLYATATDYGYVTDPEYLFLPKVGLDIGCRHLAELVRWAKGDIQKALGAYNGGKGNWDKRCPHSMPPTSITATCRGSARNQWATRRSTVIVAADAA